MASRNSLRLDILVKAMRQLLIFLIIAKEFMNFFR